jgi:pyruvate/2-oxoglutarate dehydrogenase complex dihydrolipoamide acyltransferase (E2) component
MIAPAANVRMQRATLGSVAIHVVAALMIPALAWSLADTAQVETVSFTHIMRIRILRPPAPMPHPRAVAPQHAAVPTLHFAHKITVVKIVHRSPFGKTVVATNSPAAPNVAAVAQAGDANAQQGTTPSTDPTPATRDVASTGKQNGGYLPFGAEQPVPVLDPAVRDRLSALGTHVTLIVTVGDDGHTTDIVFQPPLDAASESKIRALLADANWDPAVCGGGVACEAQATIKL